MEKISNTERGNRNLLSLAAYLRSRSTLAAHIDLKPYDQKRFMHKCGSPACSLGLWAHMNPDRWAIHTFYDRKGCYNGAFPALKSLNFDEVSLASSAMVSACRDFHLRAEEFYLLFGSDGCDHASDEIAAAEYIEWFVARRRVNSNMPKELQGGANDVPSRTVDS